MKRTVFIVVGNDECLVESSGAGLCKVLNRCVVNRKRFKSDRYSLPPPLFLKSHLKSFLIYPGYLKLFL